MSRLFSNGQPDTTISINCICFPVKTIYCHSAFIHDDGSILASIGGLDFSKDAQIAYINLKGRLDSTIATDGLLSIPGLRIMKILPMSDGRLICGGFNDLDCAVARILKDGQGFDKSFGLNGIITTDVAGWQDDEINTLLIQSDGKILVAGQSRQSNIVVPRVQPK